MSIGISVAVVVTIALCGWFVVVQHNALAPLLCFRTGDQAEMLDMFENDPLSGTPEGGRLQEVKATTYDCDNGHGGSPTTPQFAQLTRLYTMPAVYDATQLRERFAQAAAAAGWATYEERSDGEGSAGFVSVRYCRAFGERVADAWINSRHGPQGPQLEITLDARRDKGSLCA